MKISYENNESSYTMKNIFLTLSWRPLSYRNQSVDLASKSMDWFLYDNGLRHEIVKIIYPTINEKHLIQESLAQKTITTLLKQISLHFLIPNLH